MAFAQRALAGSPCMVMEIGLGTVPIGALYSPISDLEAALTLNTAWETGLRYFDTAPQYGTGLSELRLGAFLRSKPRGEFVVSTKVGRLLRRDQNTDTLSPIFDFSYDGVMRSLEESLERLGLDYVDFLFIHDPDDHYVDAIDGAYRALDDLRSQGVVKAIGVGMNQSEMLVRFAKECRFDCFLLAGRYTLLDQSALEELLPVCIDRGIAVVVGGVYNSGILADPRNNAKYNYQDAEPDLIRRALDIEAVCARHDVSLKAAAVQFSGAHPAIVSTLLGARTSQEVKENAALFKANVPGELWSELKRRGYIPDSAPTP